MAQREVRFYKRPEVRAESAGSRVISGHAAVFNVRTNIAGMFLEELHPGCFARAVRERQDVACLNNHMRQLVLARTTNGTLALSEDQIGLKFRADLVRTTDADDVLARVRRRDIAEMSFGFAVPEGGDDWTDVYDSAAGRRMQLRTVKDCDLFDVSPVTYAQYSGTDVAADERGVARMAFMFPAGAPDRMPMELRSRLTAAVAPMSDDERRLRRVLALRLDLLEEK